MEAPKPLPTTVTVFPEGFLMGQPIAPPIIRGPDAYAPEQEPPLEFEEESPLHIPDYLAALLDRTLPPLTDTIYTDPAGNEHFVETPEGADCAVGLQFLIDFCKLTLREGVQGLRGPDFEAHLQREIDSLEASLATHMDQLVGALRRHDYSTYIASSLRATDIERANALTDLEEYDQILSECSVETVEAARRQLKEEDDREAVPEITLHRLVSALQDL